MKYAAEIQRRVNDRLRHFAIALGILGTWNGGRQNPLGDEQCDQSKDRQR